MKQIEKLAGDYADGWLEYNTARRSYIEGFRKARDMAADILVREINNCNPCAAPSIIGEMGEDEVEE